MKMIVFFRKQTNKQIQNPTVAVLFKRQVIGYFMLGRPKAGNSDSKSEFWEKDSFVGYLVFVLAILYTGAGSKLF